MGERLPRWMHRIYAHLGGYFWIPCPSCGRMFGGHEEGGGSVNYVWESDGSLRAQSCCPRCPGDPMPGISWETWRERFGKDADG